MNVQSLLIGAGLFLLAQSMSWFQTNGQFISPWIKDHPVLISALMGIPVGMGYIYGTTYIVAAFDGSLWPARIFGFVTGIVSFSVLTFVFMKEGISIKTGIILLLATTIVLLQIFWKV